MKNIIIVFFCLAFIIATCSCGNQNNVSESDSLKTTDNLKTSFSIEQSVHDKCIAYAQKAQEENLNGISLVFSAIALSEQMITSELSESIIIMNAKTEYINDSVIVKTTSENLADLINLKTKTTSITYQEFLQVAGNESADNAGITLEFTNQVSLTHLNLLKTALNALDNKKLNELATSYEVCPKCGEIYVSSELPPDCMLCGTSGSKFINIK